MGSSVDHDRGEDTDSSESEIEVYEEKYYVELDSGNRSVKMDDETYPNMGFSVDHDRGEDTDISESDSEVYEELESGNRSVEMNDDIFTNIGFLEDQDSGEDTDISESESEDYEEKYYEELGCGNRSGKMDDETYPNMGFSVDHDRGEDTDISESDSEVYEEISDEELESGNRSVEMNDETFPNMGFLEDQDSGEDTDISESESEDYEEKYYEELGCGNRSGKIYDETYFPKKRKRDNMIEDLVQHANGVGKCNLNKRTTRDKANHLAKGKYLEQDETAIAGPSEPGTEENPFAEQEEEACESNKLGVNLTNVIEAKELYFKEMKTKFEETSESLNKLMKEKDLLHQTNNDEIRKMQRTAREHLHEIFNEHEKLKMQLQTEQKELHVRGKEVEQREVKNEHERKKLTEELEQNATTNRSVQAASKEQRRVNAKVMKVAEQQQRQIEELHKKIIHLESQLDTKHAAELEIEQLKGTLNGMKHMRENVEELHKKLREKEEDFEDLESLNNTLVVKERKANEELQDARKELVNGLRDYGSTTLIGVKRMGELNSKLFYEALKKTYDESEAEEKAIEICSLWEEILRDPGWHPIKVKEVDGNFQAVIVDDEKLTDLRNQYGEEAYKAVTTAKLEINEFNPSGSYIVSEVWNFKEGRKAKLNEGVAYLLNKWRLYKAKRRRRH